MEAENRKADAIHTLTPRDAAVLAEQGFVDSVTPEVSQLDYSNSVTLAGYTVPSLISRRASTTVELASGEHLVIGLRDLRMTHGFLYHHATWLRFSTPFRSPASSVSAT